MQIKNHTKYIYIYRRYKFYIFLFLQYLREILSLAENIFEKLFFLVKKKSRMKISSIKIIKFSNKENIYRSFRFY